MDRRTLVYVVLLSALLFGVNWFFEGKNQEALKVWHAQQKARNEVKIKELEQTIQTRTVPINSLPITDKAVKSGSHTVSIVDGKIKDTAPDSTPLPVADLPDFGKYDLQLYVPAENRVLLGHYEDGQFTLLSDELATLKGEEKTKLENPAIALFKTGANWLPVALYNPENDRLEWLDEMPNLAVSVQSSQPATKKGEVASTDEKYFVLENSFQQLVFSSKGGALAEINLPFKTKENQNSVVKEIGFDRDMVEQEPQNAKFPAHAFKTSDGKDHAQGKLGGYYPLIRRDLMQKAGKKSIKIPPKFYALNIVSEYPELAELNFTVKEFTPTKIVFEADLPLRKITKTFTLEDNYIINMEIQIDGDVRGLWVTSGIPEVEWISGAPAPVLKYRQTKAGKAVVENIDLPKDAFTLSTVQPDWVANSNGFLGTILDTLNQSTDGFRAQFIPGALAPSRLVEIDEEYDLFPADKMPGYMVFLPLKASHTQLRVFAGPFATNILQQVDATYSDSATGYNPDYLGSQTFHGWFSFISEPFAKFLLILMRFFYAITHSWAFSIVLLTVALRVMLYPLNAWSLKSTIQMQKIAPEIAAIQAKNKKDPKKAQMEIVNLYRDRGINPLSGCLPLLIQMPFLIGMFDLLKSTFELRGASFIPGWIDDLAAPDVLFSWSYPLPFIGNEFHLLPFILGGVMFLQQKMMTQGPTDPKLMTDQQRQSRAMGSIMPIVFTFIFYNFPSGLNIYWLSSMLLGMLQQWWTARTLNAKK